MKKTRAVPAETCNNEGSKRMNRTNWFSTATQALYWTGSPWSAFGDWLHNT
ncbi:MAG: hypothetical protein RSB55_08345 [Oscillospiraceae bacterium]